MNLFYSRIKPRLKPAAAAKKYKDYLCYFLIMSGVKLAKKKNPYIIAEVLHDTRNHSQRLPSCNAWRLHLMWVFSVWFLFMQNKLLDHRFIICSVLISCHEESQSFKLSIFIKATSKIKI